MALVKLKQYIEDADKNGYAIGCFNVISLESIDGVIEAAGHSNSPVCITIHPPHFKYTDIETAADAIKKRAAKTDVPVILHLDNAVNTAQVIDAVRYGFTSIMYIGEPEWDFETKVKRTQNIVEMVHAAGNMIESDVCLKNNISGTKDSDLWKRAYIDSAVEFCERTRIDVLSVDVVSQATTGSNKTSEIDLGLLKEIKGKTGRYLSLHGGSGVSDEGLRQAFKAGLNKMHIYGRSADRALAKMKGLINSNDPDIIEVLNAQREGFMEEVEKSIGVFGSKNMASKLRLVDEITVAVLKKIKGIS